MAVSSAVPPQCMWHLAAPLAGCRRGRWQAVRPNGAVALADHPAVANKEAKPANTVAWTSTERGRNAAIRNLVTPQCSRMVVARRET